MNKLSTRLLTILLCIVMATGVIGISVNQSQVVHAQTGPSCGAGSWDTTYFNDTNLGATAFVGCTASSSLNSGLFWGTNGPAGGVGPNNFSGRFTTNITFVAAGTYRFTASFEDNARLFINGQLTSINFWGVDITAPQTATADFNVATANTTVSVVFEVAKFTGNGQAQLNWALSTGGGGGGTTTGSPWTAEFFNNRTWTAPAITGQNVPAGPLGIDWQFEAPATGVLADGWSSRFTRVVNFPSGGAVSFETRADDTVTIRVDGNVVTASEPFFVEGAIYRGTVTLAAGNHTIVVEHTDIVAQAYIFVNWSGGGDSSGAGGSGGGGGTPVTSPTGVTGTVSANVGLNFRQGPSTSSTKLGKLDKGQTYAVLGRNAEGTWAFVEANGTRGWAFARWLTFNGDFSGVPIVDSAGNPITLAAGVTINARPVGNMRIRECAGFSCGRLGFVPWGDIVGVFGQSADHRWIKIQYVDGAGNVVIGWSFKLWYRIVEDLSRGLPNDLPIVQ